MDRLLSFSEAMHRGLARVQFTPRLITFLRKVPASLSIVSKSPVFLARESKGFSDSKKISNANARASARVLFMSPLSHFFRERRVRFDGANEPLFPTSNFAPSYDFSSTHYF